MPSEINHGLPVAIVDSDDGDTCYYTCPHCHKRSHSEFDKWTAIITSDPTIPPMICPKCGNASFHPDDI